MATRRLLNISNFNYKLASWQWRIIMKSLVPPSLLLLPRQIHPSWHAGGSGREGEWGRFSYGPRGGGKGEASDHRNGRGQNNPAWSQTQLAMNIGNLHISILGSGRVLHKLFPRYLGDRYPRQHDRGLFYVSFSYLFFCSRHDADFRVLHGVV